MFDVENISPELIFSDLFTTLEKNNFIAYPRKIIFNNVTQLKKTYLGKAIKEYHLDLICTYSSTGKNIADFRLYMEVMDLLYSNKSLDGFAIVSADSDYSELAIRLRHENKYIIGIGPKDKCKDDYVILFDQFYFIEDLLKKEEIKEIIISQPIQEEIIDKPKVSNKKKKETVNKKKKQETKIETKKEAKKTNKKKTPVKDEVYYQELSLALEAIKNDYLKKGTQEIFYATLVKELKEKSFYLETFKKITFDDLNKCNYSIEYKEDKKKETAYISLTEK